MLNITDDNFDKEVLASDKIVLVDFWMEGCAPCALLLPLLEELEAIFEEVVFVKVNLATAPIITERYGIEVAPTVVLFWHGEPLSGFMGLRTKADLISWLREGLLRKTYLAYAKTKDIALNPDRRITEGIIKGLVEKEKEFGFRYCPCRRISGDLAEDKKIICPCVYHLDEIEKEGKCLCGLFVRKIV